MKNIGAITREQMTALSNYYSYRNSLATAQAVYADQPEVLAAWIQANYQPPPVPGYNGKPGSAEEESLLLYWYGDQSQPYQYTPGGEYHALPQDPAYYPAPEIPIEEPATIYEPTVYYTPPAPALTAQQIKDQQELAYENSIFYTPLTLPPPPASWSTPGEVLPPMPDEVTVLYPTDEALEITPDNTSNTTTQTNSPNTPTQTLPTPTTTTAAALDVKKILMIAGIAFLAYKLVK
jgi:hypothetical protein